MDGLKFTKFFLLIRLTLDGDNLLDVLVVSMRVGDGGGGNSGAATFPDVILLFLRGRSTLKIIPLRLDGAIKHKSWCNCARYLLRTASTTSFWSGLCHATTLMVALVEFFLVESFCSCHFSLGLSYDCCYHLHLWRQALEARGQIALLHDHTSQSQRIERARSEPENSRRHYLSPPWRWERP